MTQAQSKQETAKILQLVSFEIGEEKFGVEILCVKEIIRILSITRVPGSPDFVEGVINLRGQVVPVVDLRRRLGIGRKEFDATTRMIVVELGGQQVGFIVDVVSQVLRIPAETIEPPPQMVTGVDSEYIQGLTRVGDRLLMLLDLQRILSRAEQAAIRKAA